VIQSATEFNLASQQQDVGPVRHSVAAQDGDHHYLTVKLPRCVSIGREHGFSHEFLESFDHFGDWSLACVPKKSVPAPYRKRPQSQARLSWEWVRPRSGTYTVSPWTARRLASDADPSIHHPIHHQIHHPIRLRDDLALTKPQLACSAASEDRASRSTGVLLVSAEWSIATTRRTRKARQQQPTRIKRPDISNGSIDTGM
jgi:hypothetical protein